MPAPSTAADWGLTKWPGSRPDWPQDAMYWWLVLPAAPAASGAAAHSARSTARAAAGASRAAVAPEPWAPLPPFRAVQGLNANLSGRWKY